MCVQRKQHSDQFTSVCKTLSDNFSCALAGAGRTCAVTGVFQDALTRLSRDWTLAVGVGLLLLAELLLSLCGWLPLSQPPGGARQERPHPGAASLSREAPSTSFLGGCFPHRRPAGSPGACPPIHVCFMDAMCVFSENSTLFPLFAVCVADPGWAWGGLQWDYLNA